MTEAKEINPLRIPFEIAITEPRLLKSRFDELSLPQQVALRAAYGCDLPSKGIACSKEWDGVDDRGFTPLDYWWASQGFGTYDPLGYLLQVSPPEGATYTPHEYGEAWGVWGVRAGKSDGLASTSVVYEAICGGHEGRTRKGKKVVCFLIAQDIPAAQYALVNIRATLASIPFLRPDMITAVTARRIDLWNGVTIAVTPPTVKAIRGYDAPVAVMDEVGVWWQEAEAANPDFEIYRQVKSRQAQFTDPKIFGISSPWRKAGLLWSRYEAGTNGERLTCKACLREARENCEGCRLLRLGHRDRLVLHGTTAGLGNPLVTKAWLQSTRDADPRAFEREEMARFQESVSGFLDPDLLRGAVSTGTFERPAESRNFYVAAMDPAFRRDSFAFAIVHADATKGIVVDYLMRETPPPNGRLNPSDVLAKIAQACKRYKVIEVLSDQYQIESLKQIAMKVGLSIREVTFSGKSKAEIYANLRTLLNTHRLDLLDHPETLRELLAIEAQNLDGGGIKIAAPRDDHDDMATVVALASHGAVWMLPSTPAAQEAEPTYHDLITKQIAGKARLAHYSQWD